MHHGTGILIVVGLRDFWEYHQSAFVINLRCNYYAYTHLPLQEQHSSSDTVLHIDLPFSITFARSLSRDSFPHRTSPFDLSFTLLRYFNIRDERWNPTHLAFYSYQRHFREIFMTISRFLQQRKRAHEMIIRGKYSDEV